MAHSRNEVIEIMVLALANRQRLRHELAPFKDYQSLLEEVCTTNTRRYLTETTNDVEAVFQALLEREILFF